jgi:hypothetical protein
MVLRLGFNLRHRVLPVTGRPYHLNQVKTATH